MVDEDRARYSRAYEVKKRLMLAAFCLHRFFSGVEYGVILPTVLIYTKSLHGSLTFSGFIIAMYPCGSMLALPLVGHVFDQTKRTRVILIGLNSLLITGNLIYSLPLSKWLLLVGRLLTGFGNSANPLIGGEVMHAYSEAARFGVFTMVGGSFMVGMLVGPSLNIIYSNWSFDLHVFKLNSLNLPGVSMACIWICFQCFTICFLPNLSLENERRNGMASKDNVSSGRNGMESLIKSGDKVEEADDNGKSQQLSSKSALNVDDVKEFFCCEWLLINLMGFILTFLLMFVEVCTPYLMEFEYGYTAKTTSMVYMIISGWFLLNYAVMLTQQGKVVTGYHVLVAAIDLALLSTLLLGCEIIPKLLTYRIVIFSFVVATIITSSALRLPAIQTIITRIISPHLQGRAHGMYNTVEAMAMTAGSFTSGYFFHYRLVFSITMLFITYVTYIGYVLSITRLEDKAKNVRLLSEENK